MNAGHLEATVVLVFTEDESLETTPLSPEGCLVVELDLQEILQVNLCYIVHDVSGGEVVKENRHHESTVKYAVQSNESQLFCN